MANKPIPKHIQVKQNIESFCMIPSTSLYYGLSSHSIHLYCALARFANNDTKKAWPSYDTLLEIMGISRGRLSKSIKELESEGFLVRESGKANRKVNQYYLKMKGNDSTLYEQSLVYPVDSTSLPREQSLVYHVDTNYTHLTKLKELETKKALTPKQLIKAELKKHIKAKDWDSCIQWLKTEIGKTEFDRSLKNEFFRKMSETGLTDDIPKFCNESTFEVVGRMTTWAKKRIEWSK